MISSQRLIGPILTSLILLALVLPIQALAGAKATHVDVYDYSYTWTHDTYTTASVTHTYPWHASGNHTSVTWNATNITTSWYYNANERELHFFNIIAGANGLDPIPGEGTFTSTDFPLMWSVSAWDSNTTGPLIGHELCAGESSVFAYKNGLEDDLARCPIPEGATHVLFGARWNGTDLMFLLDLATLRAAPHASGEGIPTPALPWVDVTHGFSPHAPAHNVTMVSLRNLTSLQNSDWEG